jgi:radical SAM superfamily enzyme YgiQ (UPF0313 family)
MRVLFLAVNRETITMPTLPLGLACVASATERAGHQVKLVNLTSEAGSDEFLGKVIRSFCPDVIALSVRNIDDQGMGDTRFLLDQVRDVVMFCRTVTKAPLILGGAGYSIYPESALAYLKADMGIKGEGEKALPALFEQIESGRDISEIPGLYLPGKGTQIVNHFVKDLDAYGLPDEHLWLSSELIDQDIWIPLQTRRGCPMNCSYCSTPSIEGAVLREHSPEAVVEVVVRYVKAGFDKFYFTDNTFNLPPSYAKELCRRIQATGVELSWMCIVYPGDIEESLIRDMARAGCREVTLGFESGSEYMLRSMNKRFTLRQVLRNSELLEKYGIRQMGCLLLGGPGETQSSVEETLSFADSLPLTTVKVTSGIRIYPHTALAQQAVDEGRVSPDDDLLYPRFYLAEGLENWLDETLKAWMDKRPHWSL